MSAKGGLQTQPLPCSPMVKIFITGNAGSGKTTLAHRLGSDLKVPVHSLDEVVWRPGWRKTPADERDLAIARLVANPRWVIEGVSPAVLACADMVIFLDVTRRRCIVRCARRNWRYLFSSRPGLPDDCPEIKIIGRLLQIIWRFPRRVRPGILASIEERPGQAFIATTDQQADEVLELVLKRARSRP
jgi:adenylate kinase family enzyme